MRRKFLWLLPILGVSAWYLSPSNAASPKALSSYLHVPSCENADFELLESEETLQDWRYVVRISNSDECHRSLLVQLQKLGAQESDIPFVGGLLLPGHTDTQIEAVAFDFDAEPGTVIWTRDKA